MVDNSFSIVVLVTRAVEERGLPLVTPTAGATPTLESVMLHC